MFQRYRFNRFLRQAGAPAALAKVGSANSTSFMIATLALAIRAIPVPPKEKLSMPVDAPNLPPQRLKTYRGPISPRLPFPSPLDRTPNEPALLLSPQELLKLYNAERWAAAAIDSQDTDGMLFRVDERVYTWAAVMAKVERWDEITIHGQQVLLKAAVMLDTKVVPA